MAPLLIPFTALGTAAGASAATATSTGLMLAGAGVAAAGQIQAGRVAEAEGKSAQNLANYNAAVMEQEAKAAEQKGRFEQQRQAKKAERIKSRLRASIAKTGAVVGVGTPLLVETEQAAELDLENLLIGYEARTMARRARSQAEIDRLSGKVAKRRGKAERLASYTQAGTTLLTGFSSVRTE